MSLCCSWNVPLSAAAVVDSRQLFFFLFDLCANELLLSRRKVFSFYFIEQIRIPSSRQSSSTRNVGEVTFRVGIEWLMLVESEWYCTNYSTTTTHSKLLSLTARHADWMCNFEYLEKSLFLNAAQRKKQSHERVRIFLNLSPLSSKTFSSFNLISNENAID